MCWLDEKAATASAVCGVLAVAGSRFIWAGAGLHDVFAFAQRLFYRPLDRRHRQAC